MPELRCTAIRFCSTQDEAAFFEWAHQITAVRRVFGDGHDIVLTLRSARPSDAALRELLALFKRYRVAMQPLAMLLTDRNAHWFAEPTAWWFGQVFAKASQLQQVSER